MLKNIDIQDIIKIAKDASVAVMEIYKKDFSVDYKDDKSPLTEADLVANEIICSSLKKLYPHIPIMSEENKQIEYEVRKNWEYYWCIDPIDGTKEFVKKNGEFTINIALIYKNRPALGVVYAPVLDEIYYAKEGEGAFKDGAELPIIKDKEKFVAVASKSHRDEKTDKFIADIQTNKEKEIRSIGSSLKLCLVASGIADIYPRFAPTMEWDTAAAHAIVLESGGSVIEYETKQEMRYNKENLLNNSFVVKGRG